MVAAAAPRQPGGRGLERRLLRQLQGVVQRAASQLPQGCCDALESVACAQLNRAGRASMRRSREQRWRSAADHPSTLWLRTR
jgi:hypothetical protein